MYDLANDCSKTEEVKIKGLFIILVIREETKVLKQSLVSM